VHTLTVQFHQFFYLLNVGTKGGVVLLPSIGHTASLQVGSSAPMPLFRTQVNVVRWPRENASKKTVIWGEATTKPGREYLVHSEDIFGRQPKLRPGLVDAATVPDALNARVVLSGGTFIEEEARNRNSRGNRWTFHLTKKRPPRQLGPRALTDRVRFEMPVDPAYDYALALTAGGSRLTPEIELPRDQSTTVIIANRDVHDPDGDPTPGSGFYCLVEFDHLHALLELDYAEQTHPVGDYTGGIGSAGTPDVFARSNGDPICSGEQGDCPDPQDPECEPPGTGGG
jgi:hypothetical protein